MLHLKDNIKKIRKALSETQEAFANRMGVTLGMQKSYEHGKSNPDLVYIEKLCTLSGYTKKDVENAIMDFDEIKEKVTKVTSIDNRMAILGGPLNITLQDYLNEKEARRAEASKKADEYKVMVDKLLSFLNTMPNFSEIQSVTKSNEQKMLTILDQLFHLREKTEGRSFEELIDTADNETADRLKKLKEMDNP